MISKQQMIGRARRTPTILSLIYFQQSGTSTNTHCHILTTRDEVMAVVEKLKSKPSYEETTSKIETVCLGYEDMLQTWMSENDESHNLCLSEDNSVFYFGSQDGGEVVEDRIQQYKTAGRKLGDLL